MWSFFWPVDEKTSTFAEHLRARQTVLALACLCGESLGYGQFTWDWDAAIFVSSGLGVWVLAVSQRLP